MKQSLPQHPGRFAPLLGMMADEAAGDRPGIDFLSPRRKPAAPSNARRNLLIGATVAAVAAGIVFVIMMQVSALNRREAALLADERENREAVKAALDRQRRVQSIEEGFVNGDINWLDEIKELSNDFPDSDHAIVTQLTVNAHPLLGAKMSLEGYMPRSTDLQPLEAGVRDERHSVVGRGAQFDESRQSKRQFPWRFTETITVLPGVEGDGDPAKDERNADGERTNAAPPANAPAPVETPAQGEAPDSGPPDAEAPVEPEPDGSPSDQKPEAGDRVTEAGAGNEDSNQPAEKKS